MGQLVVERHDDGSPTAFVGSLGTRELFKLPHKDGIWIVLGGNCTHSTQPWEKEDTTAVARLDGPLKGRDHHHGDSRMTVLKDDKVIPLNGTLTIHDVIHHSPCPPPL